MKIDVLSDLTIRLRDVFNSVLFETEEGEKLAVCMRDGGFEIGIKDQSIKSKTEYYQWFRINGGVLEEMINTAKVDVGKCDGG